MTSSWVHMRTARSFPYQPQTLKATHAVIKASTGWDNRVTNHAFPMTCLGLLRDFLTKVLTDVSKEHQHEKDLYCLVAKHHVREESQIWIGRQPA